MLGPKYSFWWTPKPSTLAGRRNNYNNFVSSRAQRGSPITSECYRNVMYDKRVIRGTNYGSTSVLAEDPLDRAAQLRRRNALRKRINTRNQRNVLGTPPPVMGRRHEIIQTDQYLEELLEHPPVRSADTQTDLFLEQPPTPPHYVPGKIGVDVGTAIEADDLVPQNIEITNLAVEADKSEPLIERFVEACILDSTHEVECEMNSNIGKVLENQVAKVLPNVLDKFESQAEESEREQLMSTLCPWLSEQVADEVAQIVDSQEILGVIIEEIIKQRGEECVVATLNNVSNDDGSDESKTM